MADVHRRVLKHDRLRGLNAEEFSDLAGEIIGDVNYVHPYREGNGRTQLYFYKQLAEQAGLDVDLTKLTQERWMAASRQAHMGDYDPIRECLRQTLTAPERSRTQSRIRRR